MYCGGEGLRMKVLGMRLPAVVVIFLLTFSGLVFSQGLIYRYSTERPLQMAFEEIQGVLNVESVKLNGFTYIKIELGDIENLKETYHRLQVAGEKHLGKNFGGLIVEDGRSDFLEELYYSVHFDIQEAMSTGNFSNMADSIAMKAKDAGVDRYRVYVENEHIFLQLHKGSSYLYQVIPRGFATQDAKMKTDRSGRIW